MRQAAESARTLPIDLALAVNVAQMRELYDRVVKIAEGATLMTETTLEIEFDGASSELLPNATLEAALHARPPDGILPPPMRAGNVAIVS